jgi:hypothetical protein
MFYQAEIFLKVDPIVSLEGVVGYLQVPFKLKSFLGHLEEEKR